MTSPWTPERIKTLRRAFNESQQAFSDRLGVAIGTLQWWEQGKGPPSRIAENFMNRLEEDVAEKANAE